MSGNWRYEDRADCIEILDDENKVIAILDRSAARDAQRICSIMRLEEAVAAACEQMEMCLDHPTMDTDLAETLALCRATQYESTLRQPNVSINELFENINEIARLEGWTLFLTPGQPARIRHLEDDDRFKNDDEATAYVTERAAKGSALHRNALTFDPFLLTRLPS